MRECHSYKLLNYIESSEAKRTATSRALLISVQFFGLSKWSNIVYTLCDNCKFTYQVWVRTIVILKMKKLKNKNKNFEIAHHCLLLT